MKQLAISILLIAYGLAANAQSVIEWEKSFGGSDQEVLNSIQQTADGGYIAVGYTRSDDIDVSGFKGATDWWIIKLNSVGDTIWTKTYGGSHDEGAQSVRQTVDGGYIVAGYTNSKDGDVSGNHSTSYVGDFWVVKLDSIGDMLWAKALGGTKGERANDIRQTSDGGYIVVGHTDSNDGDVNGNKGSTDCWIVKLDSIGDTTWTKTIGGSGGDDAQSVVQTDDGGYILTALTSSSDGDVHGSKGNNDIWIVKLNSIGDTLWTKTIGGTKADWGFSIQQTSDGGYILGGGSQSSNGDVHMNRGGFDYYIVKMDSMGDTTWTKTLGGTSNEWIYSLEQTVDGGYILGGYTESNNGDVVGNHGSSDFWIVKLSNVGSVMWTETIGGTGLDRPYSIRQTNDGGYIIGGHSMSNDGDVTVNHGSIDFWIVKLSVPAAVDELVQTTEVSIYPNPSNGAVTLRYELPVGEERGEIILYSETGAVVKRYVVDNSFSDIILDNTQLPAGTYFYRLATLKGGAGLKKMVVVK